MAIINIIIADDHPTVRGGLKYALETESDFNVVGEAGDGIELIKLTEKLKPDVIIVDINMPKMSGLEAISIIRERNDSVKILVITMHKNEKFIKEALKTGINGFLFKMAKIEDFLEAVNTVAGGGKYFGKDVLNTFINIFNNNSVEKSNTKSEKIFLTDREKEILKYITEGYTSKEIGEKLFLSHYTIENHRKNMIQKMGLKNTTALIKYSVEKGLIP